jgi:hypothetical protein
MGSGLLSLKSNGGAAGASQPGGIGGGAIGRPVATMSRHGLAAGVVATQAPHMRTLVFLSLLLTTSPALAEREPVLDAYFACLVGNAAVEFRYGLTEAEAFDAALKACTDEAAAANKEPGGDMGSAGEGVEHAAASYVAYMCP